MVLLQASISSTDELPASLLSTITLQLSERQKRIMEVIDNEDYTPVIKKVIFELKEEGKEVKPEYLAEGVLALKQYYAICFMDDNAHAISDTLDPFWHAHILHTVPYHKFSEKLGIGYMHHAPNDMDNSEETGALRIMYEHTQNVFSKCYNWTSPVFNPRKVKNERLLCSHYTQTAFVHEGDNAFPRDPVVREAEMVFVRTRRIPQQ